MQFNLIAARITTWSYTLREHYRARLQHKDDESGFETLQVVAWAGFGLVIAIAGYAIITAVYNHYAAQIPGQE
jgi:hypothetical protein